MNRRVKVCVCACICLSVGLFLQTYIGSFSKGQTLILQETSQHITVLSLHPQWLTVAAWKILTMVKSSSLIPHLIQRPTILAIWDTDSAMETALALVKLIENGLEVYLLVNVSGKMLGLEYSNSLILTCMCSD